MMCFTSGISIAALAEPLSVVVILKPLSYFSMYPKSARWFSLLLTVDLDSPSLSAMDLTEYREMSDIQFSGRGALDTSACSNITIKTKAPLKSPSSFFVIDPTVSTLAVAKYNQLLKCMFISKTLFELVTFLPFLLSPRYFKYPKFGLYILPRLS